MAGQVEELGRKARKLADPEREIWTVEDVAEYFQVSDEKVRVDARKGMIPGFTLGSLWRFKSQKIREFDGKVA